jgi:hypothetical protein
MKSVLDDAATMLPEAKRTSAMKAQIASHILACAAKGERDPLTLKTAALLAVVECTNYSHDISPARRAVWGERYFRNQPAGKCSVRPTERHPPGLQCRLTNRCRGDVARHEVHADAIRNGASVRQMDERIPPVVVD